MAELSPADRDAALAIAARLFGVQPTVPLMREAIQAGKRRDEILARHEQRLMMRLP
jgi:hypothetical protein